MFRRTFATVKPNSSDFLKDILAKVEKAASAARTSSERPKNVRKPRDSANINNINGNKERNYIKGKGYRNARKSGSANASTKASSQASSSASAQASATAVRTNRRTARFKSSEGVVDVLETSTADSKKPVSQKRSGSPRNAALNKKFSGKKSNLRIKSFAPVVTHKTEAYKPESLTPASLLKFSSLIPATRDLRVLNATVSLIESNNDNVHFWNNEEVLTELGTLMQLQGLSTSLIPNPKCRLDSNATNSTNEFASINDVSSKLQQLKSFANLIKDSNAVSEQDLKTFNSIIKGDYEKDVVKDQGKGISKPAMALNFAIAKNIVNNNPTLDSEAKLKAFSVCAGKESIKESMSRV